MFHPIPNLIHKRMIFLEGLYKEQQEGSINPLIGKLCQIPPETGQFISILAASTPKGNWLELGTGGGYSTLWLSLSCQAINTKIYSFEKDQNKLVLARETIKEAQISAYVELVAGDLLEQLNNYRNLSFCFLDTSKDIYSDCYEIVIENMVSGGILIADNAISHQHEIQDLLNRAQKDVRVDSIIVPIGKGLLMCRAL